MKLSIALVAAALAVAPAAGASAGGDASTLGYTPIPAKSQQAFRPTRKYVQCVRKVYLKCAKKARPSYYRYRYCRRKAESECRSLAG